MATDSLRLHFRALLCSAVVACGYIAGAATETTVSVSAAETTASRESADNRAARTKPTTGADPAITHHELQTPTGTLRYTATAATMPLMDDKGTTEATIFYTAYTLDDAPTSRSLMFAFNGGPGSASVWLHFGVMGPLRLEISDDGNVPPPPYRLLENPDSWLRTADLVFIDPVGTGYSRAAKPELNSKFHNVNGDIASIGEFIRMYLGRNERWSSPLFVVGESYGTTRAAGLSDYLINRGIALNGIVLVSTVINFSTLSSNVGNDLPYVLILPTYAAGSWYHHKLPDALQRKPLPDVLREVERWSATEYATALLQGDRLPAATRASVLDKLAAYTGLEKSYVDRADLRIDTQHFCKELLQDKKRVVGRMDVRMSAPDSSPISETPDFDPSLSWLLPPFTSVMNSYLRDKLNYRSDFDYYVFGPGISWDWGAKNSYTDTSEALRSAMAKNPNMKLFVAAGLYDLATPHFATEHSFAHMQLDPGLRKNVEIHHYLGGHMMYLVRTEMAKLRADIEAFAAQAVGK